MADMVLKTELCRFSGAKIYPGRGIKVYSIGFYVVPLLELQVQAVLSPQVEALQASMDRLVPSTT